MLLRLLTKNTRKSKVRPRGVHRINYFTISMLIQYTDDLGNKESLTDFSVSE